MDSLVVIQGQNVVKPRAAEATSIPGMLKMFQDEWDALTLETFNLRKQLHEVRHQLAQSLYQQDAACRVIARLLKERDEARSTLANAHLQSATTAQGPSEITKEVSKSLVNLNKTLSAARRKRTVSSALASTEEVSSYRVLSSHPLHKASQPGVLCVAVHPSNASRVVSGGVDHTAIVFDRETGTTVATLRGHTRRVNEVLFHPTEDCVLTGSADKSARVWTPTPAGYGPSARVRAHSGAITGLSMHASGNYFVTASEDQSWAFHDLHTGNTLLHVKEWSDAAPIHCAAFHPDGLLLATGTENSAVRLWDVNSKGKNVATFTGHQGAVSSVCFSENGYHMVTAAQDNTIKMWDLRKLKEFQSFGLRDGSASRVSFDFSGTYVAAAANNLHVFTAKDLAVVKVFEDHSNVVTDAKFGPDASWLVSTSMDRTMKFWGGDKDEQSTAVAKKRKR